MPRALPPRNRLPFSRLAFAPAIGLLILRSATAQEEDAEYARLRAAVDSYEITTTGAGARLELDADSLLKWTNPVRQQERGAVFIWLLRGRPAVIGSHFTYEYEGKVYDKAEFHSLADERLEMTHDGDVCWTPKPGLHWEALPHAGEPSTRERQRLVQMRSIARGYRVRLFDLEGEATELRCLAQPLYRYSAPDEGVLDGAIFSYAVATDPEALLIVEATEAGSAGRWRCAFARFHYWRLEAETTAGIPVWTAELDRTQESHVIGDAAQFEKPYVSFRPTTQPVRSVEP